MRLIVLFVYVPDCLILPVELDVESDDNGAFAAAYWIIDSKSRLARVDVLDVVIGIDTINRLELAAILLLELKKRMVFLFDQLKAII